MEKRYISATRQGSKGIPTATPGSYGSRNMVGPWDRVKYLTIYVKRKNKTVAINRKWTWKISIQRKSDSVITSPSVLSKPGGSFWIFVAYE